MPPQATEPNEFTDEQLKLLLAEPGFGQQDFALLTPSEQSRATQLRNTGRVGQDQTLTSRLGSTLKSGFGAAQDVATGAMKGLGDTATSMIGMVPGAESLTTKIGNALGGAAASALYGSESVTPEVPSAQASGAFDPSNTGEKVGKVAEQLGEFMVPAGAARKAAIKGLVQYGIPNSASPQMMKILNRVAALAGRTIGEGASAAGVSALHGDEDPVQTGVYGAGVPLATEALAQGARSLPVVGPLAAGVGAAHMLGPLGVGMVGGLALSNRARSAAGRMLSPAHIQQIQDAIRSFAPYGLRASVGAANTTPDQPQQPARRPYQP